MVVDVLRNHLNLSFERSAREARQTVAGYAIYAGHTPRRDLLFREGDVVLVWNRPPTPREQRSVESCLRE